jgi:hypothetical protein
MKKGSNGDYEMLHDEYKEKISQAVRVLTSLIQSLEGTPIDPRAVQLLDIATSYLEEQKENEIEYHETIEFADTAPETTNIFAENEDTLNFFTDNKPNASGFKYLEAEEEHKPKAVEPETTKPMGELIAEEIQKWFEEGAPENEGA